MYSGKITDYELGNSILHKVADSLSEIAAECRFSHPEASEFLSRLSTPFIEFGQDMERLEKGELYLDNLELLKHEVWKIQQKGEE